MLFRSTTFIGRDSWDGNGLGDLLPSGARSQSFFLREWLDRGNTPASNRELIPILQKKLKNGDGRKESLLKTLQQVRDEYEKNWQLLDSVRWYQLPETWELRKDIDLALEDIQNYVIQVSGPKYS